MSLAFALAAVLFAGCGGEADPEPAPAPEKLPECVDALQFTDWCGIYGYPDAKICDRVPSGCQRHVAADGTIVSCCLPVGGAA